MKGEHWGDEIITELVGQEPTHECWGVWTWVHRQLRAFEVFEQNNNTNFNNVKLIICRSWVWFEGLRMETGTKTVGSMRGKCDEALYWQLQNKKEEKKLRNFLKRGLLGLGGWKNYFEKNNDLVVMHPIEEEIQKVEMNLGKRMESQDELGLWMCWASVDCEPCMSDDKESSVFLQITAALFSVLVRFSVTFIS